LLHFNGFLQRNKCGAPKQQVLKPDGGERKAARVEVIEVSRAGLEPGILCLKERNSHRRRIHFLTRIGKTDLVKIFTLQKLRADREGNK
jgi:hypothetical protein